MKRSLLFVLTMMIAASFVLAQPPVPSVSSNSCGPKTLTTVTPPVGTTYYWQGTSCGTLNTNSNLTYVATVSGTYFLRAYTGGSWSDCSSVIVTVNPIPATPATPTVSTNLCGPKVLTRANPPAGVTYYWQGTSCSNANTDFASTYTATTTGTFYLRAYATTGACWSECASVAVTYYPEVVASISLLGYWYYDNDPNIWMAGNPPGGTFSGPGVLAGDFFSPSTVGPGDYVIVYEYTDGNGCYDSVHHPVHVEQWTGIGDVNYDRFVQVYPNPVTDQLTVKIDALFQENIYFSVVDLYGKTVSAGSFINQNIQTLNLDQLNNGVYFLRLQNADLNFYKKIVIQH